MNETLEMIKERRSIRKYQAKLPTKEEIEMVVQAGLEAASGRNRQPVHILAVTQKALRDKLSAANAKVGNFEAGVDPFYGAPVVLVVLADKRCPTYLYDGSLAMGNMMLAAKSIGLGSCWIHRAKEEFEQAEFKSLLKELGVEGDFEGIGHCILGYPDQEAQAHPIQANRVTWVE